MINLYVVTPPDVLVDTTPYVACELEVVPLLVTEKVTDRFENDWSSGMILDWIVAPTFCPEVVVVNVVEQATPVVDCVVWLEDVELVVVDV